MLIKKKKSVLSLTIALQLGVVGTIHAAQNTAQLNESDEKVDSINSDSIEVITVSGTKGKTFKADAASSATLLSLPLDEIPFNVGVVTKDLIDDLQIDDLSEAVLLNASVSRSHSHSNNSPSFLIRGFALDPDRLGYLINGVPVASTDTPPAHTSALSQIEVLKGTAALFYGAGEPAGVINYVYKTPLAKPQYSLQATIGENDEYRGELDLTGPISETLLYRFTLGWEDSKGIVDYDYSKDFAPTLQLLWLPTEQTSIRLIGEYIEHEGNPLSADTVFFNGNYLEGSENQYLGFSSDYEEQDSKGIQIHADHRFSDDLLLKVQVGYKDGGRDAGNSGYLAFLPQTIPGFSDANAGLALRSTFDQRRRAESEYLASHLAWDLSTGSIEHQFIFGLNYSRSEIENVGYFNSIANVLPSLFAGDFSALLTLPPSVNIFNPEIIDYEHATNFGDSPPFSRDIWEYDNWGLNIQDAISIPSMNLKFLLGLRYANSGASTTISINNQGVAGSGFGPDTEESKWIPRVGAIYDLNEEHSFYLSYGESFKPPFSNSQNESREPIVTPETGEQYELGWKGSYLNGKFSSVLAFYELTKKNVIVATPNPEVFVVAGEQTSRGAELDIVGNVTDDWQLYFSYAYTDTEIIDAGEAAGNNGERFPGIPLHKLVFWNNLKLDWAGAEGFEVGYGLDYSSDILSGAVDIVTLSFNNVPVDGQGLVHNASLGYQLDTEMGEVDLSFMVKNMTDRFYVQNVTNTIFAKRGEPRTVMLTAKWAF